MSSAGIVSPAPLWAELEPGDVLADGTEIVSVERGGRGWVTVVYRRLDGRPGRVDRLADQAVHVDVRRARTAGNERVCETLTRDEMARRIGARVRELRVRLGWSQVKLSMETQVEGNMTGINRPNLSRIELGRYGSVPNVPTVVQLARALRVSPSEIFSALDKPLEEET